MIKTLRFGRTCGGLHQNKKRIRIRIDYMLYNDIHNIEWNLNSRTITIKKRRGAFLIVLNCRKWNIIVEASSLASHLSDLRIHKEKSKLHLTDFFVRNYSFQLLKNKGFKFMIFYFSCARYLLRFNFVAIKKFLFRFPIKE